MKKIIIFLWNDYDFDDRVKKKSETLSKKFKVIVKCVCKNKKNKSFKKINDNLEIYYYWFSFNFLWYVYRFFLNPLFWKSKIDPADFYDCNDPDTLYAGKFSKKKYKGKLIYDSHEYWMKFNRFEFNLFYSLYSFFVGKVNYFFEKKNVVFVDKIISVSPSICDVLEKKYFKPTFLICNFSNYLNKTKLINENKNVVFFGRDLRGGCDNVLNYFANNNYNVTVIGNIKKVNPKINYVGFISKEKYTTILLKQSIGIAYISISSESIKYSLSNKIFEYIQTKCIPIINYDLIDTRNLLKKYNLCVIIKDNDYNNLFKDLDDLFNDKQLNKRFDLAKKELSWEAQEKKLLKIYT